MTDRQTQSITETSLSASIFELNFFLHFFESDTMHQIADMYILQVLFSIIVNIRNRTTRPLIVKNIKLTIFSLFSTRMFPDGFH